MFIAVCTIEMHVPDSGSLKTKRQSLRSLKEHCAFSLTERGSGGAQLEGQVTESGSGKTKRQAGRGWKGGIGKRFNVRVREAADNNLGRRDAPAVAAVSNDKSHLNQTIDHVLNMVRAVPELSLLDYHIEII